MHYKSQPCYEVALNMEGKISVHSRGLPPVAIGGARRGILSREFWQIKSTRTTRQAEFDKDGRENGRCRDSNGLTAVLTENIMSIMNSVIELSISRIQFFCPAINTHPQI